MPCSPSPTRTIGLKTGRSWWRMAHWCTAMSISNGCSNMRALVVNPFYHHRPEQSCHVGAASIVRFDRQM